MRAKSGFAIPVSWFLLFAVCWVLGSIDGSARVLDNFDDNTKTDWTDFTFVPGFGIPVESGGQFKFTQPPAGQAIFSASTKTSETFTLQDGRTVEFRVDVVSGGGKDSFAVLAFIPTSSSASSLAGYGVSKSATDILITKGIGKYFYNQNPTPAIKNDNITLVLSMTGQGSNVVINAKVLDKDANNAVIFDHTVVDTPGADVLDDGTDSPAAPYMTSGNFVLYLFQDYDPAAPEDPYQVTYDNAEVFVLDHTVLDDFNDNTKTAWQDFSFIPGFGIPTEANGQFQFVQPAAGQAIFSASTKTSRAFDVVDGARVEFRVDLVSGGGKDSFAVLAFIPTSSSASSLAGYGISKSTTDILITKGIGKYFYNENPTPAIKNDNVTLVLSMEGRGSNVVLHGQVLDKDNNNAVIFDQTFVDTPAADVLADGTDSPAAAYFGSGNLVLYLFQDYDAAAPENPYQVTFDNAEVWAPPLAGNTAPVISDVAPAAYGNFLPATTQISFKAADDKALAAGKLAITLNGVRYASTNGLSVTGAGNALNATLGGLETNVTYQAVLEVTDADDVTVTNLLYFDTFLPEDPLIEIEDYNFGAGQFIDDPVVVPEGNGGATAYNLKVGGADIDYHDTRTDFRDVPYRPDDNVRMQHSLDLLRQKFTAAGGAAANVFDYDVGDVASGEFMNYTRTFAAGTYEIYLRQAYVNLAQGEAVLERVTGDRTQPNPTTQILGSFLGVRSGYAYRNIPLTDGLGANRIKVRLSGVETIRLRQVTAEPVDGSIFQNYLVLVPVADAGVQRATVTAVSPAQGATVDTVTPVLSVTIQNRDTLVQTNTISLLYNGAPVAPVMTSDASGAVVTYAIAPLPAPGTLSAARIVFSDSDGVSQTNDWTFTITYRALDPVNRNPGTGGPAGFNVRVVQAPQGSNLENSLQRAEEQLSPNSTIPKFYETNVVEQVINQAQDDRNSGFFPGETLVPGLDDVANGTDDFAVEIRAWLDLSAGVHRFGVVTDDGYQISSGASPADKTPVLAFHNGGPADETFDFVVTQAGLYPFRMIWYERGGNAYSEWSAVDVNTGDRALINDLAAAGVVKAYTSVVAPPGGVTILNPHIDTGNFVLSFQSEIGRTYTVESSVDFSSWTGPVVQSSNGDGGVLTIPIPLNSGHQIFYRIRAQ
jgi:hypothetical protein